MQLKLNEEVREELCQLIENGNYLSVAAQAVGIDRRTLTRWRTAAREIKERLGEDFNIDDYSDDLLPPHVTPIEWQYLLLEAAMTRAEARAEAYAVLIVRKHMPDQWTAAMTYLERRFPDRWRKRQTIEAVDGGTVIDGIDEDALIEDSGALALLHDALEHVAKAQVGPGAKQLAPGLSTSMQLSTNESVPVDSARDQVEDDQPGDHPLN